MELLQHIFLGSSMLLAALPSSTSYQLHNYGFGSGGSANSSSASYKLNGISGEVSGQQTGSASFKLNSGNNQTQQAHVPLAPTFDNPGNYYSKLHLVVNPSSNPSDSKFAIAISSDSFASTQYIQNDGTVGSALGIEDYQTYAGWGGASGSLVIGLEASTTYQIKAKAISGSFTETGFGPSASATTSPPSLAFDIDIASTDSETAPPYEINFSSLLPGIVSTSSSRAWIDIDTNAESGAKVYVSGASGGLNSPSVNHTITSATGDLSALNEGFGVQSATATQASGGPLTASVPYNVSSENVGIVSSLLREIYSSANPITTGRGSFVIKAKAAELTPSSDDYQELLTVVAAASF